MRVEREKKAAEYMQQVMIGDVFAAQWGYEQTNVDFYQVVKKSTKTVTVAPIKSAGVDTGWCQREVVPIVDAFTANEHVGMAGKRCTMQGFGSRPAIKICDYANAYLWDGSPMHETSWY